MGFFLTSLDVRVCGDRDFELLAPLRYQATNGDIYEVDAGQHTDFASVWYIPIAAELLAGRANKSATIHDDNYRNGKVPRLTADQLLYECALAEGEPKENALILYEGVRIGGKSSYKGPPEWAI